MEQFPGHPGGIIPADAGSTSPCRCRGWRRRDHPRGCGEHALTRVMDKLNEGSSPRMRGALCAETYRHACIGIIPADAGSTYVLSECYHLSEDHPRGCGEHTAGYVTALQVRGSSPRMRGALAQWCK